jgi:hypothetical protein
MVMPHAAPRTTLGEMGQLSFAKFHKTWASSKAVNLPLDYQTQRHSTDTTCQPSLWLQDAGCAWRHSIVCPNKLAAEHGRNSAEEGLVLPLAAPNRT